MRAVTAALAFVFAAFSPESSRAIVGGLADKENKFGNVVSLEHNGRFVCTALLVDSRTAYTAGHCVYNLSLRQDAWKDLVVVAESDKRLIRSRVIKAAFDPPPEKWSDLNYVF